MRLAHVGMGPTVGGRDVEEGILTFVVGGPREPGSAPWRVLAGAAFTGGAVGFGEARLPPHTAGPNRHVHTREDEASYIISGVLTVVVGDRTFEAGPETLVWLPRGLPHTFANRGDEEVRCVGVTSPAGMRALFEEQAAYFASLQGLPDHSYLAELGARFGVSVVGPPLDV
jgi:mannose-6-phosphate isomerase-like protein (cupin superfamily)